jgi:dihydroorotase
LLKYVCDGVVDTIGSDHAPHTHEEKSRINYDAMPSGVPGVETLLPILLSLVSKKFITLERLIDLTSRNAARIFGLAGKSKIEEGCDADLVLINPNREIILSNSKVLTKCGWTPYDGMIVKGVPEITIVGGVIIRKGPMNL